jgi:hypothetical protein
MSAKSKVLKRLRNLYVARTTPSGGGSTTLSAIAAKGATTLTVVGITNFSSGDAIRIGDGNTMELNKINGAPSGSTITLTNPLQRAHAIGEEVKEMTVYNHGDPSSEGGVDILTNGEQVDVRVATARLPITNIKGYIGASAEWAYPFADLYSFATAVGMNPATKVSGSGTVASPRALITDGTDFGEETDIAIIAIGELVDGTLVVVELWGCSADYTAMSTVIKRGQVKNMPCRYRASAGGVITTVDPAYTIDNTYRAQKTAVWRGLSEVGLRTPLAGLSTTVGAAGVAAGGTVVPVPSTTSLANGDMVKIGTGSDAEYHIVDSFVANTSITLRTKLLRAHILGETVVEQTETPFAAPAEDGVSIEGGGSVLPIRFADRALEAGIIPQEVDITVQIMLADIILANLAYASATPQADIANSRLPLDTNFGTSDIDAMYVRGLLQNGDIVVFDFVGLAQQIQQAIQLKMTNNAIATIPIRGKPATLQIRQYQ